MYADKETEAMRKAIDETDRRRAIQVAYNREHGITPETIVKGISDITEFLMGEGKVPKSRRRRREKRVDMEPHEIEQTIVELEEEMLAAAEELRFEYAAKLRDEIRELRRELDDGDDAGRVNVALRPVVESDFQAFYEQQADPASVEMAAVPARDREAHDDHWRWALRQESTRARTIVVDGAVAGHVVSFLRDGVGDVRGRLLDRPLAVGPRRATAALAAFLEEEPRRPLTRGRRHSQPRLAPRSREVRLRRDRDDPGRDGRRRRRVAPPPGLVAFLAPRAIPGLEEVVDGVYRRVIAGGRVIGLDDPAARPIRGADPAAADAHLARDPFLGPLVAARPGLRVPGTVDGGELAIRAVLGQQVSLAAARTLAARMRRGGRGAAPRARRRR